MIERVKCECCEKLFYRVSLLERYCSQECERKKKRVVIKYKERSEENKRLLRELDRETKRKSIAKYQPLSLRDALRKPRAWKVRHHRRYIRLLEAFIRKNLDISKDFDSGFYTSPAWRLLRYRVLKSRGRICEACGKSRGTVFHVDHIKPRSKFPELELDEKNLQVLCADCNIGKGAWDETDWRVTSTEYL